MSSMSPDMYVGEHKKNNEAIKKAENVLKNKNEEGTEQYIAQDIPQKLSRIGNVISEVDRRIADTERDIKGLEEGSDDKEKYNKDLEKLSQVKNRAEKTRERLYKREWTPPIEE